MLVTQKSRYGVTEGDTWNLERGKFKTLLQGQGSDLGVSIPLTVWGDFPGIFLATAGGSMTHQPGSYISH